MIYLHRGAEFGMWRELALSGCRWASRKAIGAVAILVGLAGAAIPAAQGADLESSPPQMAEPAVPVDTGWTFDVSPYGWLSSLVGNVRTLPPIRQVRVSLSAGKILNHLDGVFSGAFEAKYGRFVLFGDVLYSKNGASGNFDRQDFPFGLGFSSTFATGFASAGYRLIDDPRFSLDALAGVRGFYADNILSVLADLNRNRSLDFGVTKSWAAPMAGFLGRVNFTDQLYATGSAFVGGTDSSTNFAWDLFGGLGYSFNDRFSIFLGYRAMKIGYRTGNFIDNELFYGPIAGLNVRF
jgi:hypothetical protein